MLLAWKSAKGVQLIVGEATHGGQQAWLLARALQRRQPAPAMSSAVIVDCSMRACLPCVARLAQGLNLITPAQLPLSLGELQRVMGLLAERATQVCMHVSVCCVHVEGGLGHRPSPAC